MIINRGALQSPDVKGHFDSDGKVLRGLDQFLRVSEVHHPPKIGQITKNYPKIFKNIILFDLGPKFWGGNFS